MKPHLPIFILLIVLFSGNFLYSDPYWQQMEGPYGGGVTAIAAQDGSNIYCGNDQGEIYRSYNKGETWECWFASDTAAPVKFLTVHKGILYASVQGRGIFYGIHTGMIWDTLMAQSGNSSRALVVTSSGYLVTTPESYGILVSKDMGKTFDSIKTGIDKVIVTCLAVSHNGFLYAGTSNSGVYVSDDDGYTWTQSDTTNWKSKQVTSISVTTNNYVFAGTTNQVHRSKDNGKTFDVTMNGVYDENIKSTLAVNDTTIFIGTAIKTYYTNNYGESWQMVPLSFNMFAVQAMAQDSSGVIYSGNNFVGIYKSTDNGASWYRSNEGFGSQPIAKLLLYKDGIIAGYNGRLIYQYSYSNWNLLTYGEQATGMALSPRGDIFIGTSMGGTMRSTNGGKTFEQFTSVYNYSINNFYFGSGDKVFGSKGTGVASTGGIARSLDYGVSWLLCSNDIGNRPVMGITNDKSNRVVAITDTGFYYSYDEGDTWKREGNFPIKLKPNGFIIDGDNYYVATDSLGIMVSKDDGTTWTNTLKVQKTKSIYRNKWGQLFTFTPTKEIYQSDDNGDTWNKLPALDIRATVYDLQLDKFNNIYLATSRGIFSSTIPTEVPAFKSPQENNYIIEQFGNSIRIISNSTVSRYNIVNINGSDMGISAPLNEGETNVDISKLNAGVYLLTLPGKAFKFLKY